MNKRTDIQIISATLRFLPVETRVPLKFGTETLTSVTCARASILVTNGNGRTGEGWGETPLSVQWVWPSELSYEERYQALYDFTVKLCSEWVSGNDSGHAFEIGHDFLFQRLPVLLKEFNHANRSEREPIPLLAALVCASPFDIALHDAYGQANELPVYESYCPEFLNRDLASYLSPAQNSNVDFIGKTPAEYLDHTPLGKIPAWHLVGGLDPLSANEITGDEPDDGYPVHLEDWIACDGLNCLKIKLRGNDSEWDYARFLAIGEIAIRMDVEWLTADFNCTVTDPEYVNEILDRLESEHPLISDKILYVEQPFPYELETYRIDVTSVSKRKPLFMDESAHDWQHVRLGLSLGWTGVALKTCKTQTGALLSLCWVKAHGMSLMVQDLTNPMLAQIPHALLGARAGTIMGVESNAMQFYPDASQAEALIHPGLYQRHHGQLDLSTINGPGFGYCLEKIDRDLPKAVVTA